MSPALSTQGSIRGATSPARAALLLAALLLLTACHPTQRPPIFPPASPSATIAHWRANLAQIKTISAQGTLNLRRADGQSVTLEAAIAVQPPDRLHLRAWKFGEPVFDATLNNTGLWVWTAPREPPTQPASTQAATQPAALALPQRLSAAELTKALTFLTGVGKPDSTTGNAEFEDNQRLLLDRRSADGGRMTLEFDRATRTLRACHWTDPAGQSDFELHLDDYRAYRLPAPASTGATPIVVWPARLTARGPTGACQITLDHVEFNEPLPDAAFTPPPRATRQP